MGIPTKYLSVEDLNQQTLIRNNLQSPIHAFGIFGNADVVADGFAKPHIMETLIEYIKVVYPENFKYIPCKLKRIFTDEETGKTFELETIDHLGTAYKIPVSDFQASLGHCEVYKNSKVYNDFTATGVSINLVLSIEMQKLAQRKLGGSSDLNSIKNFIINNGVLPSADLYNLHMTVFDHEFTQEAGKEMVRFYCRATEGANFNSDSLVAEKGDFFNVLNKIHHFYEGEIELVSAGSCTRHTWLENMPRIDGEFLNGQSGVGLSFAANDHNKWVIK